MQGINAGILFNPFMKDGATAQRASAAPSQPGQSWEEWLMHLRLMHLCYAEGTEGLGRQEPYCTEHRCLAGMSRGNCTEPW